MHFCWLSDTLRAQSKPAPPTGVASSFALSHESTSREDTSGRFVESHAWKVIADIKAMANTELLPNSFTRDLVKVEQKGRHACRRWYRCNGVKRKNPWCSGRRRGRQAIRRAAQPNQINFDCCFSSEMKRRPATSRPPR
jgi:hypothetical protein